MRFHKLQERQKSSGGGDLYIKIADGKSLTVLPRGEIFGFRIKWENGRAVEVPESNPANYNRFKMNVVVSEKNHFVAKVWEYGILIYNQLAAFAEEMDLTKTKIKISRKGVGKETEWFLVPLGPIDGASLANIEAVKLNILGTGPKNDAELNALVASKMSVNFNPPDSNEYFGDDPGIDSEDLPF